MADRAHSTSRRALLAGLSATPLLTEFASAAAPPEDAALTGLGLALIGAWAAQARLDMELGDDLSADAEARSEAAADRASALTRAIEAVPATGLPGLAIKALAACWCCAADLPVDVDKADHEYTDMRLLAQVRRCVIAQDAILGGAA